MRKSLPFTAFALGLLGLALPAAPPRAPVPAQVTSGVLSGSYHSPTNQAMGNLSGPIRPEGEALLTSVGRDRSRSQ